MKNVEIVWFDVDRIIPLDYNPRFIKDEAFRKLQQSILHDTEFMELRPILLNKVEDKFYIYAGTQRWKACKDLGWKTVPVIIDDSLSEELVKERMLKDNIHAGVWDTDRLQEFDNGVLDLLDVSTLSKIKLNMDDIEMESDDVGKEPKGGVDNHKGKDKVEIVFSLVFSDQEQKKEFDILAKNFEKSTGKTITDLVVLQANNYV